MNDVTAFRLVLFLLETYRLLLQSEWDRLLVQVSRSAYYGDAHCLHLWHMRHMIKAKLMGVGADVGMECRGAHLDMLEVVPARGTRAHRKYLAAFGTNTLQDLLPVLAKLPPNVACKSLRYYYGK